MKVIIRTVRQPSLYIGYIGNNKYGWVKKDSEAGLFDSKKEAKEFVINLFDSGGILREWVEIVKIL